VNIILQANQGCSHRAITLSYQKVLGGKGSINETITLVVQARKIFLASNFFKCIAF
jgi:hypothetical protein